MAKRIYKAASDFDFLWSVLMRLLCIAVIVYLLFHYEENSGVIIVLCAFCFFFFITTGNDEIIVYEDKIVSRDTSITSFFLKNKSYNISEIKSASITKKDASTVIEAGVALIIKTILPKKRSHGKIRETTINLELKNGEILELSSSLHKAKMEEVVKAINSLV